MRIFGTGGALLAATALVSACGGSTKVVQTPGPNGLPYGQAGLIADFNTMTNTYAGVPFLAKTSSVRNVVNGTGTGYINTAEEASSDVTVTILNSTQIRVSGGSFGTKTMTATGTDPSGATIWDDGSGTTATFGVAGAGTTLTSIFFGYLNETAVGGTAFSDTFLVSGFETDPAEVAALSTTATYTGPARMAVRQTNGLTNTQYDILDSATGGTGLNLSVNFTSGSVSGSISGGKDPSIGGGTMTLNLAPTTITGNQFTTTYTGVETGTGTVNLSNTQLKGVFYGENAKEVGGTFSAQVDADGVNFPEQTNASGFFIGNR